MKADCIKMDLELLEEMFTFVDFDAWNRATHEQASMNPLL